ncbi:MAG: ACP S-malonyltransferase [Bdellovibrionales bacterium]
MHLIWIAKKLMIEGDEEQLKLTEFAQPAIVLCSVAAHLAAKEELGVKVNFGAGHSVGEWAALISSGSLPLSSALRAVRQRGREMQKAMPVNEGGMVAVMGMTPVQVEYFCGWVQSENPEGGVLQAANFNAPGQIVLSGHQTQIDWAMKNCTGEIFKGLPDPDNKVSRFKFIPLKVSAPFHSSLMQPAENAMLEVINSLPVVMGAFPVIQNFESKYYDTVGAIKNALVRQITAPVKWIDCVQNMLAEGSDTFIEFGNGKVIQGLIKKIAPAAITYPTTSLEDFKNLETLAK